MQQLPASNLREVAWQPETKPANAAERFIIFCGADIEPWVYTDEPFKIDHKAVVDLIASGEPARPHKVIGFDLATGKCRDATIEIMRDVAQRWADNDEPLTYEQFALVELHLGTIFARNFICHEVA